MALIKFVCPKCSSVYTIDPNSKTQRCPICGAPLFEGEEVDIPDLSTPSDINSLSDALRHGFKLLYFRSYDRLYDFSQLMKESYPNNYWTVLFELIGKVKLDLVFLLPKIDYTLDNDEIKDDVKSRYYHFARKKYAKSPQSTFNKIAGYYPDIPGNNRKRWNKARTKYEEKLEMVESYSEIASLIRTEYMDKLDSIAESEEQKNINFNIKVWLDQIAHAKLDLFRYNQTANEFVKNDYDRTPNPGNKPVFLGYLVFYLLAFLTLVLSVTQIVLSIINPNLANNTALSFVSVSVYAVIIILSGVLLLINRNMFRNHPVVSVFAVAILALISASGIATAGFKTRVNWFAIFAAVTSLVSLFYTSVKLIAYFPRKTNGATIIGDYQKLSTNTFDVTFVFTFKTYEGEAPKEITFSENWIHEN